MVRYYGPGIVDRIDGRFRFFLRLVEPILRAEEELAAYRTSLTPERLYELVLLITGDQKEARRQQAILTLNQMPPR
jgi:hypothetical protein